MPLELRPVVRAARLRRTGDDADGGRHVGAVGGWQVVAGLTGIGTERAGVAARAVLDAVEVDHVVVVGVAGAVGRTHPVGTSIDPGRVADRATGRELAPHPLGGLSGRGGTLMTGDEFISDPSRLAALEADGVIALDMETAAIAVVCEERGVPWSVARAISDLAGDAVVLDAVEAGVASPEGRPDLGALLRHVGPRPWRVAGLTRIARQAQRAARVAADLAVASLRSAD